MDELLTVKEALAYLKTSRSTLYRLMERGTLKRYKLGNTLRFRREDVQKCLSAA